MLPTAAGAKRGRGPQFAFTQPAKLGSGPQAGRRSLMAPSKIGLAGTRPVRPRTRGRRPGGCGRGDDDGRQPRRLPGRCQRVRGSSTSSEAGDFYLRHMAGSARATPSIGIRSRRSSWPACCTIISNGALIRGGPRATGPPQMVAPLRSRRSPGPCSTSACATCPTRRLGTRLGNLSAPVRRVRVRRRRPARRRDGARRGWPSRQVTLHDLGLFEEAGPALASTWTSSRRSSDAISGSPKRGWASTTRPGEPHVARDHLAQITSSKVKGRCAAWRRRARSPQRRRHRLHVTRPASRAPTLHG